MDTQTWSGTNSVKNLPNFMKCLNNEKREVGEVSWQSPFEIYFGRKSNELVRCGLLENEWMSHSFPLKALKFLLNSLFFSFQEILELLNFCFGRLSKNVEENKKKKSFISWFIPKYKRRIALQ